jgi:hypothetical protein
VVRYTTKVPRFAAPQTLFQRVALHSVVNPHLYQQLLHLGGGIFKLGNIEPNPMIQANVDGLAEELVLLHGETAVWTQAR